MPKKNILKYTALIMAFAFVALPAKLIHAATISGSGSAMISTGSSAGDTLTISMTGVTSPKGTMKYNAYLLTDSMTKTSIGNIGNYIQHNHNKNVYLKRENYQILWILNDDVDAEVCIL